MLIQLLIAGIVVLCVMFLALAWFVAILAKVSLLIPAGVTAAFVVLGLSILVVRRLSARRSARGLEQGLRDQAKAQAKHMRPDLEPELRQMQETFDRAVGALKNSPHGRRRGGDALYFLPWYTIIGPSGAGKTTALRHSGLKFPPVKGARDAKVRGLGGTRNCDWWLTNQAVLLDTAGRWSTEEEDHDEWLSFLGLLRKYRPRKPLNGVIAAIGIGDIVNASAEEVQALARQMRERVDEIIGQLHVSLPIYLMFTKCDLIEGFIETFGEMSIAEREQVWGFTAPLTGDLESPPVYFEQQFAALTQRIEAISLARIGPARRVEARQLVYAFPQQVMAMRDNLRTFVGAMFEGSVYHETPSLRGVYFTSGTQEGRPFSLLLARLAEALGVQGRMPSETPIVEQKSYFLRDMFMKVIFEDQDLASASQKELRRQRIQRVLLTTALAAVAVAVGVVPSLAFGKNRLQLARTAGVVDRWERPGAIGSAPAQRLPALQGALADLADYEVNAPSFLTTWGMYQGDRVRPPLRRYVAGLLRRELVQPTVARDVQSMTEFGFKYEAAPRAVPGFAEHAGYYDALELHLLLTSPKNSDEPALDGKYTAWLIGQLTKRWSSWLGDAATDPAQLDAFARRYVEYSAEYPELGFARDANVVRRTRAALQRVSMAQQSLEGIIARVAEEDYDLALSNVIGNVQGITGQKRVRGAFTRRGWENIVRDQLTPDAMQHLGELWVLGLADRRDAQRQRDAQVRELSTLYFRTYVEEWRAFLRGLRVERPSSHGESLTLLNELLRGQPTPLALLTQNVLYNVQLKPKPVEALVGEAADAIKRKANQVIEGEGAAATAAQRVRGVLPESAAERDRFTAGQVFAAFQGFTGFGASNSASAGNPDAPPTLAAPLMAYEEQLASVRDALQLQGAESASGESLTSRMQAAQLRTRTLIEARDASWRPVFEALLLPPIEGASSSTHRDLAESLARRWCTEVAQPFDRTLADRYPFDRRGHDLPLESLSAFYQPGVGSLWRFTRDALGSVVALDGDRYVFTRTGGTYTQSLPQFLTYARDLSTSFFPPGSDKPKLDFEVRVHPAPGVASTSFSLGGKSIEYHNGPERWVPLSWPGSDAEAGAGFVARGANGMQERAKQEGVWGLFRLIEAGTVTRPSNQVFTVAWQLRTHDVTLKIDIRPVRPESPFFGVPEHSREPQLLQPVRDKGAQAPRQITHAAQSCNI